MLKRQRIKNRKFVRVVGYVIIAFTLIVQFCVNADEKTDGLSRHLKIIDGDKAVVVSLQNLLSHVQVHDVEVDDPVFGGKRKYSAVYLQDVFNFAGIKHVTTNAELKLVCADGYVITASPQIFNNKHARPMLAINAQGIDPAKRIDGRWEAYQQGKKIIGFDPFYLVWELDDSEQARSEAYPWPYQLTSIELLKEYLVPDIAPLNDASAEVKAGYQVFSKHCMRCHQVNGIGGSLGPELTRRNGMVSVLTKHELRMLVTNVRQFFPQSAMPVFEKILSESDVNNVVDYLQSVNPQDE